MWIEIPEAFDYIFDYIVTPCAGVWIEIDWPWTGTPRRTVTPCAGVWIEILISQTLSVASSVTPCAGVWIEISIKTTDSGGKVSLPVRECGLKCNSASQRGYSERHSLCGSVD